jgi:hypothetical protein
LSNFRLVVVFIAIALTLGACSGRTRPFGKETKSFSARLLKTPPVIKIAKIQGLSTANSRSLRRQIIREARQRGISAKSNDKGKAAVFVNGTLKVAPYGQNTAVAYVWDVSDKNNNRLMRITGEDFSQKKSRNPNTTQLNGKTIQRIAAHATSSVAAWLSRQGYRVRDVSLPPPSDVRSASILRAEASSVAARQSITRNLYKATNAPPVRVVGLSSPQLAQPRLALPQTDGAPTITGSISGPRPLRPQKQPTIVLVKPVTGASTQANIELTQAIKRALRTKGVRITESPTPSALKLVGIVNMGPISQQRRVVEINWNLNNALGQKIGLIQQKNKVKAALVANSWGQTADLAAQAAAGDIAGIIPGNTKTAQR